MQNVRILAVLLLALSALSAEAAGKKKPAPPPKKAAAPAAPAKGPAVSRPAPEEAPAAAADGAPGAPQTRGPTRIDFDDRLIQGQTNKSGAVYLYDRKELKIRSMIKKRENFRDEIVSSLYDN